MAAQIDSLNTGSFKPFRPWRRRDISPSQAHPDEGGACDAVSVVGAVSRQVSGIITREPPSPLRRTNRRSRTRLLVSPPPPSSILNPRRPLRQLDRAPDRQSRPRPTAHDPREHSGHAQGTAPRARQSKRHLSCSAVPPFARESPEQQLASASSPPSLKRRRPLSDVDGPNTALLCCKKRRLRRFLITSRLSQPFSQPASHIINRESVASGDKRFLKLAAIVNAKRITRPPLPPFPQQAQGQCQSQPSPAPAAVHPPCPSEVLRRVAMANRLRRRILADAAAGRSISGAPVQLLASARFAMVPVSAAPVASSATLAAVPAVGRVVGFARSSAADRTRSPSKSPRLRPLRELAPVLETRLSMMSGSETKDDPQGGHQDSSLDERSCFYDDDGRDDDGGDCAFPTSEHESRYEASDDPEDVYSDFSVLFNSTGDDTDWSEEGLDDYMDELDGIAHLPKSVV